jgi:hypothetical protein
MIFFVHIGKTAGSTMNRYLAENYPLGFQHCEAFFNDPAALRDRAAQADWMSGHITLPVALERLSPLRSDVRYYTCVRRPKQQVRSHYNWLVEIFCKGEKFYGAHPPPIKAISEQIRRTVSNPSPARIAQDLRKFSGLFLNHQNRYFFAGDITECERAVAAGVPFDEIPLVRKTVASFDAIGESDSIEALFNHLHGAAVYSRANRMEENASRYHFDPELFEAEEIQATLRAHNHLDELLYGHLTARMTDGLLVNRASERSAADARLG